MPEELLLVETDAPYLAPSPSAGSATSPPSSRTRSAFIAGLRGVTAEQLGDACERNAARIFGWP